MSRMARVLVAVASLLMASAFVLPLWSISLLAPQYPEGIGMRIRINTVEGAKENDLKNINGLNHYIGMQAIEPDAIPELRFMPIILGVLVVTGFAVAAFGRRWPLLVWGGVVAAVQVAGLYDYWRWGYDYGHNLDPRAIIRIEGMSYQPPLIGSKQLLNFTATSWPASGGWALVAAALLIAVAIYLTLFVRRRRGFMGVLLAASAAAAACGTSGPEPITLNVDACEYCRMTISDARFGGEAVTATGRVHKFDSIECLAGFARTATPGTVRGLYVIDTQHPGTFVPAELAGYLTGGFLHSPMGRSVVAFATPLAAEEQRAMLGGTLTTWAELSVDTVLAGHATP